MRSCKKRTSKEEPLSHLLLPFRLLGFESRTHLKSRFQSSIFNVPTSCGPTCRWCQQCGAWLTSRLRSHCLYISAQLQLGSTHMRHKRSTLPRFPQRSLYLRLTASGVIFLRSALYRLTARYPVTFRCRVCRSEK